MLGLSRNHLRTASLLAAAIVVSLATAATAATGTEKVKAHPGDVMVNTDTTITGKGFPAHTTLSLNECGVTFWLAPNDPCNTENAETVETDAKGRFTTSFKVQLCPEGMPARRPTTRICYIGVLHAGEDSSMLEPAARMKVSYP